MHFTLNNVLDYQARSQSKTIAIPSNLPNIQATFPSEHHQINTKKISKFSYFKKLISRRNLK